MKGRIFVIISILITFSCFQIADAYVAWTGINITPALEYAWPVTKTSRDIDYFASVGMNVIRLPFSWEWMQPVLGQPLNTTRFNQYDTLVRRTTDTNGIYALIDPHNFARYNDKIVGQDLDASYLADLWSRLATLYADNDQVLFGLMNEPHDMSTLAWKQAAQAAVTAIRATGATNYILVPGNGWTSAVNWQSPGVDTATPPYSSAEAMIQVDDPLNKIIFEVHQYFDDGSGTKSFCKPSPIAHDTLIGFTNWLRKNNRKGFLGEFGVYNTTECFQALLEAVQLMHNNSDVWAGWTYWAAGTSWDNKDYILTMQPTKNYTVPNPRFNIVQPYLSPQRDVFVPISPPIPPPSQTCIVGITNDIFTDYLGGGWSTDASWATGRIIPDTSTSYSGNASASFTSPNYGAVVFYHKANFSTSDYSGVEFYIKGGAQGQFSVAVGIRQGAADYGNPVKVDVAKFSNNTNFATTWAHVYVPWSAFDVWPGDNLNGVLIQSSSAAEQPRIYLDEIRLVCIHPPIAPTAMSSPSSNPSTSSSPIPSQSVPLTTVTSSASSTTWFATLVVISFVVSMSFCWKENL